MIFEIKENKVITMEGGAAEIDPYVLERWGDNPNDPNKKSTKCRNKTGIIDYNTAADRFETYYDKLNRTDSGKMRGKMFDKKYNKKNSKLLYPGLPCSEKYLEEDGPSKYDMWGVDAFPEGNQVPVNVKDNVITHYYSPKEKYPMELKYGPEITYTHLLNQYGEEGARKFLEENWDSKLFNKYFKEIKPPKWNKNEKRQEHPKDVQIILDSNSEDFDIAIERKRNKRSQKKQYKSMPVKFPLKKKYQPKSKILEQSQNIEYPSIEKPDETPNDLEASDMFYQPIYSAKSPQSSGIINYDDFEYLSVIYNVGDIPTLYNNRTKFIYEIPLLDKYKDQATFENYKVELFDLLEKPYLAMGKMTLNGPEIYT